MYPVQTSPTRTSRRRGRGESSSRRLNAWRPGFIAVWLTIVSAGVALYAGEIPADWQPRWTNPPAEDRPLQIVHGIPAARASVRGMKYYRDLGLGGIVCNVAFQEYMQSEKHWNTLIAGVEACKELGLVVWLYDEDGYPSGAAGGLVIGENRAFEATELAYDPSQDDPFIIRPAYEHSHASNNYHAARRCANLIDDRAIRCFITKTHEAYRQRLGAHFGTTIQAMFTDEPSLMAVNIGPLPEDVRKKVRVVDPLDPAVKMLPRVPWCYDLPQRYKERYGEDLMPARRSLFEGRSEEDRRLRRQFWALLADLISQRYFGAIQEWCGRHGIAASGHKLWEEQILHHVPFEGNGLKVLARMDIPGLDMLSSDPAAVIHSGWLTAGLPSSAAMLTGGRRVMTEVSDFSQKMGGAGPVDLSHMRATAAWQAAWGVTDFTLYYGPNDRPAEDYRAYCDFAGRLNAVLKPAKMDRRVLLYYPIHDLWEEYLPVPEPLKVGSQSGRAQRIVGSFMRLGQTLQRTQIPFTIVDHEYLAGAKVGPDGGLSIAGRAYDSLLLPGGVKLPPDASKVVGQFRQRGGRVPVDGPADAALSREAVLGALKPAYRISPPSDEIALGQFTRDGHKILLAVNVSGQAYEGQIVTGTRGDWHVMDPASGAITAAEKTKRGVPLTLAARQSLVFVQEKTEEAP